MKGQLAIICCNFFAALRPNLSPSSKRAVSEGAPKPNLANIQVKLVLLKRKKKIIAQSGPRKLGIFAKQISFHVF